MWFFQRIRLFLQQNAAFSCACAIGYFAFVAGAFFVSATGRSRVYCALAAVVGGGWCIFSVAYRLAWRLAVYGGAGLCVLGSVIYLGALVSHFSQVRAWRRSQAVENKRLQRLQYALPERENTFVQARLNSLLQTEKDENDKVIAARVDMCYAKKLLAAVLEQPLSATERLQAEDLQKIFAAYLKKPSWTAADVREVNDTFSLLMKLCAKHSVVV